MRRVEDRRTPPGGWLGASCRHARVVRAARARGDDGQVMLLSIAFGVIALLLVTVVISASSIHLERKRLLAVADSLAADAADAIDEDAFYLGELSEPVPGSVLSLADDCVRASVEDRLARHRQLVARFEDFAVVAASTPDGHSVEVTLAAVARPALISWVTAPWSDGVVLRVTARARAWDR